MENIGGICPICNKTYLSCTCNNQEEETVASVVDEFLDYVSEVNENAKYPTDLKEAVIGLVERFGMEPLILLDREKCINILMDRDGMIREDAEEFFEFNVIGSWLGDGTPCFATLIEEKTTEKEVPESSSFFQNKNCEYFPCHKLEEINCLFCYCPLYAMSNCGGNFKLTNKGMKDCSGCNIIHCREGYNLVISKLMK